MAYSPNQPREADGKFSRSVGTAGNERNVRADQRYPIAPHDGQRSIGSHAGRANVRLTSAARERAELNRRADDKVYLGPARSK